MARRGGGRDLLVAGHTIIDRYWMVDGLPERDRTVPVHGTHDELGGTAANIARATAARGVRTGLISRVGPDFPAEYRRILAKAGIDLRGFDAVRGERSPTCLIVEDGRGGQMTLIDQGAMEDASKAPVPTDLVREYPWLHVTTGDPEYQLRLAAAARAAGGRVAADPAQEVHYRWKTGPLRELLRRSEILFGNESEIREVARRLTRGRLPALTSFVPLVIVTRGRRGARAISRRGAIDVPARRARALRQVTGAGDSFRGGFYAAYLRGAALEDALREGVESAADWVETGVFGGSRK